MLVEVNISKWIQEDHICELLRLLIILSHIFTYIFTIFGYIMNSQHDLLPVGLIAQLVKHCTSIAEAMGSNPIHAFNL